MANENAQTFYVGTHVILKTDKEALALHKTAFSDGTPCDLWTLPGGKIDRGENEHETLKRELSEELGFDLTDQKVQFVGYFMPTGGFKNGYRLCSLMFLIKLPERFQVDISSEHDKYKWLPWNEFLNTRFHSDRVKMKDIILACR
ncbi:NUDIX hydrolase [Candidatus Dojkabacteria bacterium]|uniref:NUDIX hydrolase n=1 Tax=Candidatus Dojkabacteria bacterium TaxID=2099670 RepID=A0A955RJP3_9BACT|nr:NUDIX hydrolase [Candidatus Dojkabacteria bacterium]